MLPGGIILWTIIAGVCLVSLIAGVSLSKAASYGGTAPSPSRVSTGFAADKRAARSVERRRSKRFVQRVRVFAYSHAPDESPFHEEATTLEVSAHGGLLALGAEVCVGQKLLLTNIANQEERECRVVRFGRKHYQKGDVAVEFAQSAPDFWQTRAEIMPMSPIAERGKFPVR
jgi:hypothetical protein